MLVSMGIIPYLYLFAAMLCLQKKMIRVPGVPVMARLVSCFGFVTTLLPIVVSLIPAPKETNKTLVVVKIIGLTGVLLVVGWLLCHWENRDEQGSQVALSLTDS